MNDLNQVIQLLKVLLAQQQQKRADTTPWLVLLIEGPRVEEWEDASAKLLVQFAFTPTPVGEETQIGVILELFTSRHRYHVPLDVVTLMSDDIALVVVDLTRYPVVLPDGLRYQVATSTSNLQSVEDALPENEQERTRPQQRREPPIWPEPTTDKPDWETIEEWLWDDGGCEATDSCWIEADGVCQHGHPSWLRRLGLI